MEISQETIGISVAIGYGLVRITEIALVKSYNLVMGKKSVQESVDSIGENHIEHLTLTLKEGFKMLEDKADKQIELLTRIEDRGRK